MPGAEYGFDSWMTNRTHAPPPPRRFSVRWSRLVEVRGPLGVVLSSACDHPLRRSGEPLAIAIQSIQPRLEIPTAPAAEMDVGGLVSHQPEKIRRQYEPFVVLVLRHVNLRNVRRQLTDQPAVVDLEIGIRITDRVLKKRRGLRRHVSLSRQPIERRWHERLGFACVADAFARDGDGGVAPAAEAAQAAGRFLLPKCRTRTGLERGAEHVLEAFWKIATVDRRVLLRIELLLPERLRIFLRVFRERHERGILTARDQNRLALKLQA